MDDDIMKDLQDLDDEEEDNNHNKANLQNNEFEQQLNSQNQDQKDNQDKPMQDDQIDKIMRNQTSKISQLLKNKQFLDHIDLVQKLIHTKIQANDIKASFTQNKKEQALIIHKCNQFAANINDQINYIIKFVKKGYNKRLPQLQSIVTNPALYSKALLQIQEGDSSLFLNNQNLDNDSSQNKHFVYLSRHQAISLRIAASSPHQPLNSNEKQKILSAAKQITLLHQHHNLMMIYLQSCMQIVAPNLCKLVGSAIASKLISSAGGIDKLAYMPACNIQVMGGNRSGNIGLGMMQRNHTGIFGQMEIVKNAPKKFQIQLVRMLATNTAKCARSDMLGTSQGIQGDKLRDQMLERFQKIQQQGGLMRIQKPLPIPDQAPKKKRGGKRYRKQKQLLQMSELSKYKNRLKFGQQGQQQIEDGQGLGMLKAGIGKLNIKIKKQNLKVSQKTQKRIQNQKKTAGMGMQSTLNFGSNQGISLVNPTAVKQYNQRKGTESYFNKQAGFKTILNQKLGK